MFLEEEGIVRDIFEMMPSVVKKEIKRNSEVWRADRAGFERGKPEGRRAHPHKCSGSLGQGSKIWF